MLKIIIFIFHNLRKGNGTPYQRVPWQKTLVCSVPVGKIRNLVSNVNVPELTLGKVGLRSIYNDIHYSVTVNCASKIDWRKHLAAERFF